MTVRLDGLRTVLETEAEALRWVILKVSALGYTKVIFESDSYSVVRAVKDKSERPILNPMIQDITKMLQLFDEASVVFSHREANRVTDRIAKEAISYVNYIPTLFSIVPIWMKSYVKVDQSV